MLARLKLILDSRLEYYQSSNLQGVLMQNIDTDYAEYLHNQRFNPYSIAVGHEDGNTVWTITTVTKEAYQQIIEPLKSDSFREFDIHKHQLHVRIIDKKLTAVSREALLQSVGRHEKWNHFSLHYETPTSFKSNGRYAFMPDFRLIYQNLMNNYNYIYFGRKEDNTELLEQMVNATYVTQCDIHSERFPLEGKKIAGCVGSLEVRINGDEKIQQMIRLLLVFGEYSGLGIKCSIGMGKIKIKALD